MNRSGFTLMELLLVVAILAVITAVASPQFFRAADVLMDDAREAQFRANYNTIKAAINMAVWDDFNNPNVAADTLLADQANTNARFQLLIDRGYMQESARLFQNRAGQSVEFQIRRIDADAAELGRPADPFDDVASAPIFMQQTEAYRVLAEGASGDPICERLRNQETWSQIWEVYKNITP